MIYVLLGHVGPENALQRLHTIVEIFVMRSRNLGTILLLCSSLHVFRRSKNEMKCADIRKECFDVPKVSFNYSIVSKE